MADLEFWHWILHRFLCQITDSLYYVCITHPMLLFTHSFVLISNYRCGWSQQEGNKRCPDSVWPNSSGGRPQTLWAKEVWRSWSQSQIPEVLPLELDRRTCFYLSLLFWGFFHNKIFWSKKGYTKSWCKYLLWCDDRMQFKRCIEWCNELCGEYIWL